MKFILSLVALTLVLGVASAGYLHGWSSPRRVVYSSPSYYSGWHSSPSYYSSGWPSYKSYGGYGGYSGGYGGWSSGWPSSYSGWW